MSIHKGQPVKTLGEKLENAKAVMILMHGRGDSAQGILSLVPEIETPGFAYGAPNAAGQVWYPNRFIEPIARNEPNLSSALEVLDALVEHVCEHVQKEKIIILGFSQGSCLSLEYAARAGGRFGAIIGLSGGLIGDVLEPTRYKNLEGTPVFLGCSDVDAHIPKSRVDETAVILEGLGAKVDKRIYPNFGHNVNDDELEAVRELMRNLITV
jgi:predicted esterase